ncbi:MAG TPA: chromosome segregation protein SMC, partial [Lachnoclostridium phytofermentans]|nr:chromosome segregation protein SMC [Lachnoclostridium phytofermentans]
IDHAIALSKKYKYSLRMVTLEGEQLNPGGSLSGGAYKNSSNLLSRRREIEELEENVLTLSNEVAKLNEDITSYKEQRLSMRETVEANQKRLSELSVEANTAKIRFGQEQEKMDGMRHTYLEFMSELKLMEEQNQELKVNMDNLKDSLIDNERISKEKEQRIEECNQNLVNERVTKQSSMDEASSILVESSNLEQSIQYVLENMRRVRRDIETLEVEEQELRREAEHSTEQKNQREEQITINLSKKQEDLERLHILEEKITLASGQKDLMSQNHKEFLKIREELQNRLSLLDKETFRLQSQKEKLSEVLDAQISYMWEEYELTVSTATEYQEEELGNPVSNKKGITELKNSIKTLGDVNVNAIEDYKNLSERYEFLTTQKADLISAEESLLGIINELDEEMRRQFEEKFADIKEQFDIVFKELFGGGKGTLELTEDEDILEAGIRIIAQPPGKKLQNMMQLSGGEKALTAISLLFAIQNLKPSPFCLLDEIEAALDDSNVKRYANYLHKLTKDTQFIIITHRRGTMAAADVLYGITMQEKGVSTLVSVSLIEDNLDS